MIPFTRMLNYGNIAEDSKIVKIQFSTASWMILLSNGELHGRGNGAFGDGQAKVWHEDWTLIRNNVKNFWMDQFGNSLMLQETNNKVYYTGSRFYRTSNDNTMETTFKEDIFFSSGSIIIDTVSFNTGSPSIGFIDNNNFFRVIGSQRGLNSSTVPYTNWNLVSTNIIAIGNSGTNWWTINTSGQVHGGGQNIASIFSSAPESTFYSYPVLIGNASTDEIYGKSLQDHQYAIIFPSYVDKTWYGRGFGFNGVFGNGSTNNLTSTTIISNSWPMRTSIIGLADNSFSNCNTTMYYTNEGMYVTGNTSFRGLNDGTVRVSPVKVQVPFNTNDIVYLDLGNSATYVYLKDGSIYMCGRFNTKTEIITYDTYTNISDKFGKFPKDLTKESMKHGLNVNQGDIK
ncbi:putative DNA condensation protein [Salmonella phage SE_PL]|uniref:hypothetical protein n=1 Tax=Salmonella enterica TaxID=28901 RepID=UPI000FDF8A42|nr:DNA condensation protein [Salmonella phage Munch]ECV9083932.1 hypothetical protein [Salmonella enterica subsp. enterica serovar Infantis]EHX8550748.1 hypothetical protein [Salmonella enterica]MCP0435467.1 hypothetical protein [Salmonella enterica subsp. enterica serovar Mbandaka]QCW18644.1 hypothetical protein 7t3_0123 [Salmonella phage 7t3]QIG63045.1 putative DNA condensation protein [Salmonella phage SE_PL]